MFKGFHLAPSSSCLTAGGTGVIAFKIDGAANVELENTSAKNISNLSKVGSELCGVYEKSHPKATLEGCGGPKTRGYSIAGSINVKANQCTVNNVKSHCGSAAGFDILTDSKNITINRSTVDNIRAGYGFTHNKGPNELPKALGFRVSFEARNIVLNDICARHLKGYAESRDVLDESRQARIVRNCHSR